MVRVHDHDNDVSMYDDLDRDHVHEQAASSRLVPY
jgi:hypothetical protein